MKYVWDGYGIGLAKKGDKYYHHRAIARPGGIAHLVWVHHATEVCKVLNKEH